MRLIYVVICTLVFACTDKNNQALSESSSDRLSKDSIAITQEELRNLKDYFQIPGMAVLIKKDGHTLLEDYQGWAHVDAQVAVDSATLFPMASLTKIFSSVLIMKLLEQEKLSLEDPIKMYLPQLVVNDSIQIKHVLSHTSQGKIGERFYYSYRFGWLTKVIEQASGKSFEECMQAEIIKPLGLQHTFLLEDSAQLAARSETVAQPYFYDEEGTRLGSFDFGFSASAGLVSNPRDYAIFGEALANYTLISEATTKLMSRTLKEDLPYAYGIFSQNLKGKKILWGYGQYDCYASLFIQVPSEQLTVVLAANNNLMSDPARLIYGDLTSSLFANSILKNLVFNKSDMQLLDYEGDSYEASDYLYRKNQKALALSASFMARFDTAQFNLSKAILKRVFTEFPDYESYGDLTLMHSISFLKTVAFYRELGAVQAFDEQFEKIAQKLMAKDANNPYLNIYLGSYYDEKGDQTKARVHYERIANAENFSPFWYTQEAKNWLKDQS